MTFNNIDFKSLGLVPQFMQGVLDMPKRKGETEYDWGDEIEPLVSAEDIYFGSRDILLDAFFDERLGVDFKTTHETLLAITDTRPLVTDYGTFQVRLDEIKVAKSYKGGKTLKIRFTELNPDLSGGLPTSSGSGSIRIDGYDLFAEFGLLVEQATLYEISKLKNSKETTFKNNFLSIYRKPQELNVKVNGIYASKAEMTTKISALNATLAKEGLRHFVYKGEGFQCYGIDGHKVTIKKNRVEITLKLNVKVMYNVEELVQEVVNRVELSARPQSDLAITDTQNPAYVKGKDTFKAADSAKLNGQPDTYYAKESEIAAVRAADLTLSTDF